MDGAWFPIEHAADANGQGREVLLSDPEAAGQLTVRPSEARAGKADGEEAVQPAGRMARGLPAEVRSKPRSAVGIDLVPNL